MEEAEAEAVDDATDALVGEFSERTDDGNEEDDEPTEEGEEEEAGACILSVVELSVL